MHPDIRPHIILQQQIHITSVNIYKGSESMSNQKEKQQMRLSTFCEEFEIPKNTVKLWIHSKDFPAYKIGKCWYVDIPQFYAWRTKQHSVSYKYI